MFNHLDDAPAKTYRYLLRYWWNPRLPTLTWVMLNPSVADERKPDQTITRCIGFARGWGYGGIAVVNLYAYRATDPAELARQDDPVGVHNDIVLRAHTRHPRGVIAAWGAHPFAADRAREVETMLRHRGVTLGCLGTTRHGFPRHPVRLANATELVTYQPTPGRALA